MLTSRRLTVDFPEVAADWTGVEVEGRRLTPDFLELTADFLRLAGDFFRLAGSELAGVGHFPRRCGGWRDRAAR